MMNEQASSPVASSRRLTPTAPVVDSHDGAAYAAGLQIETMLPSFRFLEAVDSSFFTRTTNGGAPATTFALKGEQTGTGGSSLQLQRIVSLQSSSNDLAAVEEAYHQTTHRPSSECCEEDAMIQMSSNNEQPPGSSSDYHQDLSFFQDPPFSICDLSHHQIPFWHGGTKATTRSQGKAIDEDASTSDHAAKMSSNSKTKKVLPKKKKKQKCGPSRPTARSSSTKTGGTTNDNRLGPDPQEVARADTRARGALDSWYKRLRELVQFREEYGHTRVPQKYPPNRELGVWVNKQRREKRFYDQDGISSMTPIKIAKLEEAAFVWAKPKGVDAWEQRYEELQEFIAEHGHPHVPTRYPDNRALGRWVSTQRQMYKTFHSGAKYTKSLPPEEIERRISLLDSVRLSWCMMGRQEDFSSEETSLLQSAGIPYAPTSSVSVANNNKSQCDNANEDSIGLSSVAV